MRIELMLLLSVIVISCHSIENKVPTGQSLSADTIVASPELDNAPPSKTADTLYTHLMDTTFASGNFILFLRPDSLRFESLSKDETEADHLLEADGDFGFGINATMDSIPKNDKYKKVKVFISTERYILIRDCKGGPLLIDRDSIDYGVILSGTGKSIKTDYNDVHSLDYLGEIDEYFSLH